MPPADDNPVDLPQRVARLEESTAWIKDTFTKIDERFDKADKRFNIIERRLWYVLASVMGFGVMTVIVTALLRLIGV